MSVLDDKACLRCGKALRPISKYAYFCDRCGSSYMRIVPQLITIKEGVMRRILQPGSGVMGKKPGTLGCFAYTENDVVIVISRHVAGKSKFMREFPRPSPGDPEREISLRVRGIDDDLPAVLKKPVEPLIGKDVIKSGLVSGVTCGKVLETTAEVQMNYDEGPTTLRDQLLTTDMAHEGDSGALLMTKPEHEPVGTVAGRITWKEKRATVHSKLTALTGLRPSIKGFFCPISIPSGSAELRCLISWIVKDGYYYQTSTPTVSPGKALEKLGVSAICNGKVTWTGMIVVDSPFEEGDLGEWLLTADRKNVVGTIVAGSPKYTLGLPLSRLEESLNLKPLGASRG